MNLPDLSAQLESELAWRQDEIRFFQNRGTILLKADEQDQYRRAVVLVLYAHFEGFCKFAFDLYRTAINGEQIACSEASPAIAAAGGRDSLKNSGIRARSVLSLGTPFPMTVSFIDSPGIVNSWSDQSSSTVSP
jgi:hypothetical protein